ncbi:hydrogenase 2 maturation endopeptidase [Pseudovibrio axinellae]|uniref:Hydrogenase 2 maturation endopeptidase n=1 Tax=Pseudovibrio axinellae TaxID=989403 RepID=A0A165WA30_9HYPH|nr:hydrogenase maturation protease [Pseudovibrio axinellae]KZL16270.1 hydrogenase 2 maturation endopeptidase [Pseudovibrio axinellae]SER78534.1 hydrogenase maturation protease [Pseudovibrio axinellae]
MTNTNTLIIGIGNRYRSDDAFGCIVAAELAGIASSDVRCIEHDGEPATLMECWEGVDEVILVDAVSSGAQAGKIFRFNLALEKLPEEFNLYSTHAFGVPQAVELARALHKLPANISFIGVEGECFNAGVSLSKTLLKRKHEVVAEILCELRKKGDVHARVISDG